MTMMTFRIPTPVLLLALLGAGCASSPQSPESMPAPPTSASTAVGDSAEAAEGEAEGEVGGDAASGFALRPGDVIRLRIWREPDLSGEFPVAPNGVVVLPKIGEVTVADRMPAEVEQTLLEEFERYLRNPSIEITMLRRVNILGFVRAPGLYPVDPTMTLRDVLALAGGVLPNGSEDRLELIRGDSRLVTPVAGEMRLDALGIRSGDQIYVPERSWMRRNATIIAGVASTIITASVSLLIALRPWE